MNRREEHAKSRGSLLLQDRLHACILLLLGEIGSKKSGYVRLLLLQVAEHHLHKRRDQLFELFDFGMALFAPLLVDVVADIFDFGEEFDQANVIDR